VIALINDISTSVILNILCIILGGIISFPFFRYFNGRFKKTEYSIGADILIIFAISTVGLVIPLGTYGIIPIVAYAYSAKCKSYKILPFIVSNYIFNMTIPFTEANFTWKTAPARIIVACLAGVFAGIIAKMFSKKTEGKFFHERLFEISPKEEGLKGLLSFLKACIETTVFFVLFGVVLNSIFHRFIMYDTLKAVYSSPLGSTALKYMNGFNVMNPFFMMALTIANILMDITKLSALSFMLKIRGIAAYILYFLALITILASSIYFV
jgi:uncharacterized membrane protein YraQ (UPF0718 family)